MRFRLDKLIIRTRQVPVEIRFSESVTFIHGPISQGKSTVARLIDFCLGGKPEQTAAIQQEFIAAELFLGVGPYDCLIERASSDLREVRLSWSDGNARSVSAPLAAGEHTLIDDAEVYNLSDLLFYLAGIEPVKVFKRLKDPDSPMIRLSFRDVWKFCYLEQDHLDSSFFGMDVPIVGRKSQDCMRFFTGLYSEKLSGLEQKLSRLRDEQRGKYEASKQFRMFLEKFEFKDENEVQKELARTRDLLLDAKKKRLELERERSIQTHPADGLRDELRRVSRLLEARTSSRIDISESIAQQESVRAELITTKLKAVRTSQAAGLFQGTEFQRCPCCGVEIKNLGREAGQCKLCGNDEDEYSIAPELSEARRRDLNVRIDQLGDSIQRRQSELKMIEKEEESLRVTKSALDAELSATLERYDSAFVETMRALAGDIATYSERIRSLEQFSELNKTISDLTDQADFLHGQIEALKRSLAEERARLYTADKNVDDIAEEFRKILIAISYPGVDPEDKVYLSPSNWKPVVEHKKGVSWSFTETGSGGKKTLFNVCFALALHSVARKRKLPVPTLLIIDSPTKNISENENPELIKDLYQKLYQAVRDWADTGFQILIIDSELVEPNPELEFFSAIRMAGEPNSPSLIPYYQGP